MWILVDCENFRLLSSLSRNSFVQGSFNSTGLVVSSKLPRFSDLYTLSLASADPESKAAKDPVEFTKSVTQWSLPLSHIIFNLFHFIVVLVQYFVGSNFPTNYVFWEIILQVHQGRNFGGGPVVERC